MLRKTPIAFVLAFLLAPSMCLGQGCRDQRWCFEDSVYAFRVTPEVMDAEFIRHLSDKPDSPNLGQVFELLTNKSGPTFIGWVRPTPMMRAVTFPGNIGFQLDDGAVVWADTWLVDERGVYIEYPVTSPKRFVPGTNGYSSDNALSFAVFIHFPSRLSDGREWHYGEIENLVVSE